MLRFLYGYHIDLVSSAPNIDVYHTHSTSSSMGAASQFDLSQTLTVESTAMTDEVVPVVMASRRPAPSHFDRIFWVDW